MINYKGFLINPEMKEYWDKYYHYDKLVRERLSLYDDGALRNMANDVYIYWNCDNKFDFVVDSWGHRDGEGILFATYEDFDIRQCLDDIFGYMDSTELINFLMEQDYPGANIEEYIIFLKETAEEFGLDTIVPELIYHDPNQLNLFESTNN